MTDREIRISLETRMIEVDPPPSDKAFSSTTLDLTLGLSLRIFKSATTGLSSRIDPSAKGYSFNKLINEITVQHDITSGYELEPQNLSSAGRPNKST